ncbi:MAG TPA: amino acid adenylation domain-containing protein [Nannocystis exedens]|nr:amino acid adenylation domain-containing protein [Nannocystis exedens]
MLSQASGGERWRHTLAWIADSVDEYGERPAIIDRGEALSYAELWHWACAIGRSLKHQDLGKDPYVGLSLDRSAAYVAALLGTWIAGAAFVPLPGDLPELRRRRILEEVRPRVILDRQQVLRLRLSVVSSPIEGQRGHCTAALFARRPPDELAYVLYTSGSSGEPKGVMINHRGIPGLVRAQVRAFGLDSSSRSLFMLSPAFDASISDIGTALFAGAALVIVDREQLRTPGALLRTLERESITYVDMPPAWLPYLDPRSLPPSLETIVIGGEVCPSAQVRRFAEIVRVVNVYGPTEATVCASLVRCGPSWSRPLLGRPLPGVVFRVLDDDGDELQAGEGEGEGELYIGGQGLARGYLGRAEQTAKRFIQRHGERLYRSGDRVRIDAEGELEFCGRVDRQRKIGGVRIELDGIEAELLRHPDVLEAAIVDGIGGSIVAAVHLREAVGSSAKRGSKRGSKNVFEEEAVHLRESVGSSAKRGSKRGSKNVFEEEAVLLRESVGSSAKRGSKNVFEEESAIVRGLREHLARALPRAALPRRILLCGSLPRTASGKIDRRVLAEQIDAGTDFSAADSGERSSSLADSAELGGAAWAMLVAALLRRVLRLPRVGLDDRFCDLGGDSLSALELVAVAEAHGLSLSASVLLENPSVAELTAALQAGTGERRTAKELRDELGRSCRALDERLAKSVQSDLCTQDVASPIGVRRAANAASAEAVEAVEAVEPNATLFITGATGFLGSHCLSLLGRRHRGRIIVLVRAKDLAHGQRRLEQALSSAASVLGVERFSRGERTRFEVLVGDLARPQMGVDSGIFARLCREVDVIVHSAAIVNLAAGFEALRPVNVEGTATIAEFAIRGRAKLLHAISTLSVFVAASPRIASPKEADTLFSTEVVIGGYAQSKWAAEVLLREVVRGRFSLICHRLGLITGDTRSGAGPARDQLTLFLRGVAELGAVPQGYESLRVDISPVDAVAHALVELILEGPSCAPTAPQTYHLASELGASGASLVQALRRAGVSVEVLSRSRWRALAQGLGERSPAAAVAYLALGRCLDESSRRRLRAYDLFQATGFCFDSSASAAILGPRGLSIPPARPRLLDRYVATALGGCR